MTPKFMRLPNMIRRECTEFGDKPRSAGAKSVIASRRHRRDVNQTRGDSWYKFPGSSERVSGASTQFDSECDDSDLSDMDLDPEGFNDHVSEDDDDISSSPSTLWESFTIDPFFNFTEDSAGAQLSPISFRFWSSRSFNQPSIITKLSDSSPLLGEKVSKLTRLLTPKSRASSSQSLSMLILSAVPTETIEAENPTCKQLPREIVAHILSFLAPLSRSSTLNVGYLNASYSEEESLPGNPNLQALVACSRVSRLWCEESVRWIWRNTEILCHGFQSDRTFDILLNNAPKGSSLEYGTSSTLECNDSGFASFDACSFDSIHPCDGRRSGAMYPYASYIRSLSLEIAFPSLDDAPRCARLSARLVKLRDALDARLFQGLTRARLALSWFPGGRMVGEETDDEDGEAMHGSTRRSGEQSRLQTLKADVDALAKELRVLVPDVEIGFE
ncbi:hypothetical protein BC830DRAFT_1222329 [Chytriomyces sp. MP71]|nr:hypothetical protein BC830DRAFT_1222329 [Chytriomyces sp. MP71]